MIEEGSAKEGWAVSCISWHGCVSCGVPWTKSGEWTERSGYESTGMHLETLPANIKIAWDDEQSIFLEKRCFFFLPASTASESKNNK